MKTMKQTQRPRKKSVLIVGGGPGGTTLGTLLARDGFEVALFHNDVRPELLVGESLIPATIPLLGELGVEDEVRKIAVYKPGATFYVRPEMPLKINFAEGNGDRPRYAYNVLRKEFDDILIRAAERAGVHIVRERVHLDAKAGLEPRLSKVVLSDAASEKLRALGLPDPDLFVDASGRTREFSRLLGIPSQSGARSDIVRFAHFDRCELEHEGHIHIDRLSRGWSWRIPLPGRVSIGFVTDVNNWKSFGSKPEEQYDRFVREEPTVSNFLRDGRRVTDVASYSNYQLVSNAFSGANWVLVGDAAGFVDPIFSSGLDLTLNGAKRCAQAIIDGSRQAFAEYEREQRTHIHAWQLLAESFYNGNLFGLVRASALSREKRIWKHLVPIFEKNTAHTIAGTVNFDSFRFRACKFILERGYGAKFGSRLAIR